MKRTEIPLRAAGPGAWTLDCLGLLCPVPIIKAGQAVRRIAPGEELRVLADDPGAPRDLEDWCAANRHDWLGCEAAGGGWELRIRKAR